jgi:flagellar FliL protein
MLDPEEKTEPAAPPPAPPAAKGGRLIPVLVGVNTLALLAVVGLQVVTLRGAGARAAPAADEGAPPAEAREAAARKAGKDVKDAVPGPTLRLADFVVRLRDPESDRFARLSFELELPDEKAKTEVTGRMAPIRDAFLAYLSDRTADDLRGSEAIARVKGALAQKLTDLAPGAGVRGLYLTELVIQ